MADAFAKNLGIDPNTWSIGHIALTGVAAVGVLVLLYGLIATWRANDCSGDDCDELRESRNKWLIAALVLLVGAGIGSKFIW